MRRLAEGIKRNVYIFTEVSPNVYCNLGEYRNAWEKRDRGSVDKSMQYFCGVDVDGLFRIKGKRGYGVSIAIAKGEKSRHTAPAVADSDGIFR